MIASTVDEAQNPALRRRVQVLISRLRFTRLATCDSTSRTENHAACDEILDPRQVVEQCKRRAARVRERQEVVRENPYERVGERDAAGAIYAAPLRVHTG